MKPYFKFKGINSKDLQLTITRLPQRIIPELRGEKIIIPGKNGFLFESENAYNSKILEIECTFNAPQNFSKDEIDALIMQIPTWLNGKGQLILSDYPDYFYEAKVINAIGIDRLFKRYRRFLLEIDVQPFSESIEEKVITKTTSEEEIINIETYFDTYPVIEVTGNGNFSITVNNETLHFKDILNKITIDSKLLIATENDGLNNASNKLYGKYPILKPGENIISSLTKNESTIQKIEIKYRGTWI